MTIKELIERQRGVIRDQKYFPSGAEAYDRCDERRRRQLEFREVLGMLIDEIVTGYWEMRSIGEKQGYSPKHAEEAVMFGLKDKIAVIEKSLSLTWPEILKALEE